MIVLMALEDAAQVADPLLRAHASSRLEFMADEDLLGGDTSSAVIVMEPGDTSEALTPHVQFDILRARFSDCRFDAAGYSSPFETIDEYPTFFELVLVLSDYGDGVVILVPRQAGVDHDLLALCAMYAVPAQEPSS